MKDIELVIKIPEEMYKWVNDANKFYDDYGTSDFIDLVKSGVPLPKGHGDLIDKKALMDNGYQMEPVEMWYGIKYAPTIIEADRVESEG